ncbi:hypothetical protein GCM10009641_09970 [Mycobacterium cookii]|uniref:Uncharacterized protein n=1 Tax=Mycobacterium cookii TaxID=1775 RepID=A0A7I7L1T5_9MYCO|nr:hypothetical protein [Mycobacterium cookii]MCV7329817.1 hypothetical protein [Mycobacterium cookii]BBX47959.1 hypothetical protein MCOO_39740 [Mycobacterium cookii]
MTHLSDLPGEATVTLLGVCRELSRSGAAPDAELTRLSSAELAELRQVLAEGARSGREDDFVDWCTNMGQLVIAQLYLRIYHQVAIDAKAAAIVDEERRIAQSRTRPSPAA